MHYEFSRQPNKSIHLAPFLAPFIQASLSNRLTWQKYNGCSKERESKLRKSTEWANLTFTTPISSMDTNRIRIALIRKEKSLFRTYGRKGQRSYLNDHVQSCRTSNAIQNRILHQGVEIMWKGERNITWSACLFNVMHVVYIGMVKKKSKEW